MASVTSRDRRPPATSDRTAPERRVDGSTGQVRPGRGRRDERAEIADRVAPALVELARLDDDVGERPHPASDR